MFDLPVVSNGARRGPRLARVAGLHGSNYASIVAVVRVMRDQDVERLFCGVLAVIVGDVPAFRARRERICPHGRRGLSLSVPR